MPFPSRDRSAEYVKPIIEHLTVDGIAGEYEHSPSFRIDEQPRRTNSRKGCRYGLRRYPLPSLSPILSTLQHFRRRETVEVG